MASELGDVPCAALFHPNSDSIAVAFTSRLSRTGYHVCDEKMTRFGCADGGPRRVPQAINPSVSRPLIERQFISPSRRPRGLSCGALAPGLKLCRALADAIFVADCVPAGSTALAGPADPPGSLQLPKQAKHLLAARTGLLGKDRRGQSAVL
jgi:hypothetical protein